MSPATNRNGNTAARGIRYVELHCKTNFSFLRGASHPDELVARAAELGYTALAITDHNSLAGIVRAHMAAKSAQLKLLIGAEITPADAPPVLLYAPNLAGYGRLSRLITRGRRSAEKGECLLTFEDVAEHADGLLAAVVLPPCSAEGELDSLLQYREVFGDRCYLAAALHCGFDDERDLEQFVQLARRARVPIVATNDVHYHEPGRRQLHDVVTAIRHGLTVSELGKLRFANGERYLKSPGHMARLFGRCPSALTHGVELASRCTFCLSELRYEYPEEICPHGLAAAEYLAELTWVGARRRYPTGVPDAVTALIRRELELIAELHYEPYFLTVWDLVSFARSRGILCQGRGSAANSAVCYCLGITSVDPSRSDLLFERFVSRERDEAPDIDVDFEHERREEVLQYIYTKYTRDRAGIVAEVITYRPRSAVRDVGKALGLSLDCVDRLAKALNHHDHAPDLPAIAKEAGLDAGTAGIGQLIKLTRELIGFPRHLSQHVGGFVITRGPLSELVPVENAAMPDRTVIEWDKDDLDDLGILKVDCLGLGMLTAIRKCFSLLANHHNQSLTLATVPAEDPAVYDMIGRADTVGVFQIESRAQMSMLPRLLPRCFYDLVVEVAIVRPGPIQGGMVHPYLRRRKGLEPVSYPSPDVEQVLAKTLGVPLFQEQVMRLAMVAAGFTAGEADQLRRAMGAWRRPGLMEQFRSKLRDGMVARGLPAEYAEQLYQQIRGFGEYGFPEAHAASFALLAYVSAWMKCYYPAAFAAALLNSQPMGFYAPAQLVRDAQMHGVVVRPVDVNFSQWDCTLEEATKSNVHGSMVGIREGEAPAEPLDDRRASGSATSLPARQEPRPFGEGSDAFSGAILVPTGGMLSPPVANGSFLEKRRSGESMPPSPSLVGASREGESPTKPLDEYDAPGRALSPTARQEPRPPGQRFALPENVLPSQDLSSQKAVALRLGFRLIRGMPEAAAEGIVGAREAGAFRSVADCAHRTRLRRVLLAHLAAADAFGSLGLSRRTALWHVLAMGEELPLFAGLEKEQATPVLPAAALDDEVMADYHSVGLSLKAHPIGLLRPELDALEVLPASELVHQADKAIVRVAGLVLVRQAPPTAKGAVFITLEDETGPVNLVVWANIWKRYRRVAHSAVALLAQGRMEVASGVIHVAALRLEDLSDTLQGFASRSRDFR